VAAVPTANRARPEASEPPAFTPQPRVYQTAAGAPHPVSPPARPPAPPPLPVRTTAASAGLTESPPTTAAPPPPPPSTTEPTGPGWLPRQRQPGLPVYSDLLGPAPAAGSGQSTAPAGLDDPAGPGRSSTEPAGQLPLPRSPAEHTPGRAGGTSRASGPGEAAAGTPGTTEPDRAGPPVGVIVGLVLIGATVLVLGALSIPFLLERLNDASRASYTIGDCVVQDGEAARSVECTEPEAFQIVAQVDRREQCADPTQPAIEVRGSQPQFYCLVPAPGAPTNDPTD
jgi:hypothetical protein